MGDLPIPRGWLVEPDIEVKIKWCDVQIQEKKSRIVRHRQDIEDLIKGRIIEFEANIMMLEKEVYDLEQKRMRLIPIEVEVEPEKN